MMVYFSLLAGNAAVGPCRRVLLDARPGIFLTEKKAVFLPLGWAGPCITSKAVRQSDVGRYGRTVPVLMS